MNRRATRFFVPACALLVALLVGACGTTAPTSFTGAPPAGPPSGGPTAGGPTATPVPSSEPTASSAASGAASSEATPESSSASSPGTSAGSAGNACAGSTDNQSWYVTAANGLPFDIYCPVLAATWYVDTAGGGGSWRGGTDQWLQISYKGPGGAKFSLQEGAFCTGGLSLCSSHDSVIGPASFGDLSGSLDALGPTPADGYAVYVEPGSRKGYTITGTGMSQDAFAAIAAGVIKVPKS